MLRRSPSLTDQAKAIIKARILADEFGDERIPAETDLADELGVSRTTIRDALSRLEAEGVIYRKQGSGTFVNRPGLQIRSRLEEIWSYEAALEAHGYTPATRILSRQERPATVAEAAALQLEVGARLLVVEKLFLEDSRPVILARNAIPLALIQNDYQADDLLAPVFDFLATHSQQRLSYYLTEIVPLAADDDLADRLHIPAGTALISFEEVGYNEEHEPILLAHSFFRDDLIRLRLIRRKS